MQKKTVFFPPGYFLRAPDNSNLFRFPLKSDEGLFGTSRESTVFRTWTVQNNEEKDITKEEEKLREEILTKNEKHSGRKYVFNLYFINFNFGR